MAQKSKFENINDLIRSLIWPFIILLVFIIYGSEINQIIKLIPKKIETSSKISVGSISLEIEKSAKQIGNAELGEIIKNLSESGIRKLLTLGTGRFNIILRCEYREKTESEKAFSLPHDISVLEELEKNGLIKSNDNMSLESFIAFFKRKKPIERIWYGDPNASYSTSPETKTTQKFSEFTLPFSKLNQQEYKLIDGYDIELSENGRKAYEIIVQVVSEQISN